MAPTVCLSELPISRGTACPYSRRRQRVQNGGIVKQQRLQLRRIEMNASPDGAAPLTPPESPIWEQPGCPNGSCPPVQNSSPSHISARVPADIEEHWKVVLAQREGLLDIVVRTMALVRRNNILQEKVNALRAETRDFIRSVLNNPENKCRQQRVENCQDATEAVSSTTETIPSLPPSPDSTSSSEVESSNDSVSSSCCCSDWDSDESVCSSDES